MIQLKDGHSTEDARLDRVPFFDPRSRSFPVTAALAPSATPRSYTWRGGPVTDQGREGACVGHGWTGELTAKPKPCHLDNPTGYAFDLYKRCQLIDQWPGEAYSGTSVLAGAQELAARGLLTEYRWAFGFDDLILALGRIGPAVLGIGWYESMYSAPNGVLSVSGRQVGGHCILARGVNVKKQTVLLRNSWGSDWGNGGDAVISFADLRRLMDDGGEACIPTVRIKK